MIQIIKKSIYSPEFYSDLKEKPPSFSFKYFFSLVLLLSVSITSVYVMRLVPVTDALLNTIGPAVVEAVPDEAIITFKNGQATTNLEDPIVVPVPYKQLDIDVADFEYANLLVVDTHSISTEEAFTEKNTFLLITGDSFIVPTYEGVEITSLENGNMVLTKNDIASTVEKLQNNLRWIIPVMVFGIFFFVLLIFGWHLVYLLLLALLIMVLVRMKKTPLSFATAYQLGIHAMTGGILIVGIQILYPGLYIPFFFTLLTLFIVYINAGVANKNQHEQA